MKESPFLIIAEDILQEMPGKQGHVDNIAEIAIATGRNRGLSFDELKQKVNSALYSAVNRKTGSQFAKVLAKGGKPNKGPFRRGMYRIKRSIIQEMLPPPPEIKDTAFLGKGGEYAVASELMFWGFNVSLMAVDKGVDLVAEKDNKYHNIQVKTARESNGFWMFSIKNNSFVSSHSGQTYYALVVREERSQQFIIIPSVQIKTFLDTGVLNGSKTISLRVSRSESGKTWYLNTADITHFVGAFHIIS